MWKNFKVFFSPHCFKITYSSFVCNLKMNIWPDSRCSRALLTNTELLGSRGWFSWTISLQHAPLSLFLSHPSLPSASDTHHLPPPLGQANLLFPLLQYVRPLTPPLSVLSFLSLSFWMSFSVLVFIQNCTCDFCRSLSLLPCLLHLFFPLCPSPPFLSFNHSHVHFSVFLLALSPPSLSSLSHLPPFALLSRSILSPLSPFIPSLSTSFLPPSPPSSPQHFSLSPLSCSSVFHCQFPNVCEFKLHASLFSLSLPPSLLSPFFSLLSSSHTHCLYSLMSHIKLQILTFSFSPLFLCFFLLSLPDQDLTSPPLSTRSLLPFALLCLTQPSVFPIILSLFQGATAGMVSL